MSDNELGGGQVPNGRYTGRALPDTVVYGTAQTGTKQIAFSCEITKGRFAGEKLRWFGSFTELSEDRTIEQLVTAGARMQNGDVNDMTGLGDTEVELQTETNENPTTGMLECRVAWINESGAVFMKTPMDDSEKKVFAKAMKDKILAIQAKHGKRKPTRASSAPSKEPAQASAAK